MTTPRDYAGAAAAWRARFAAAGEPELGAFAEAAVTLLLERARKLENGWPFAKAAKAELNRVYAALALLPEPDTADERREIIHEVA